MKKLMSALVMIVALGPWGYHSAFGQGLAAGQPGQSEFVAEVERVDTSPWEIRLRESNGRARVVSYYSDTRVIYRGQEHSVSQLEAGDIVAVQLRQDSQGNSYTDLIRVQQSVQDRNQGQGGNTRPGTGIQTVDGRVEQVDYRRGSFEIRGQSEERLFVYLPRNAQRSNIDRFRALRAGDYVRVEGKFLDRERFELENFIVESVSRPGRAPQQEAGRSSTSQRLDPSQAARLERVMAPLLQATNSPRRLSEIRVSIVADPDINAASGGGGEFFVTTGLLEKASDEQLRGVLAHEIAHDDLGHSASAQVLGTGLNLGVILLEQLIPGSGAITPIAGTLIARGYSRSEELEADRHGVEILRRAGYSKQVMINALEWVMRTSKNRDGGGGFLSTHPATGDRIDALRKLS